MIRALGFGLLFFPGLLYADDPAMVSQMKEAAAKAAQFTVPQDIQERVNRTIQEVQTEAWQKKYNDMEKQVAGMLGVQKEYEQGQASPNTTAQGNRLYVFVSHSMPVETLRRYARDLEKIQGGAMVLRGFVEGGHRMGPSAEFVAEVIRRDHACEGPRCALRPVEFYVDPVLFSRYRVTRVPAVVYVENVQDISHCAENQAVLDGRYTSPVIYGDAALSYVLESLHKQTKRPGLAQMLRALKK